MKVVSLTQEQASYIMTLLDREENILLNALMSAKQEGLDSKKYEQAHFKIIQTQARIRKAL